MLHGSCNSKSVGRLLVRVAVGVPFIVHGWVKLANIAGTTMFFTSLNIPLPGAAAWLVALVEFLGGLMLVFGFYGCVAGALLFVDMLVATFLAHWPKGFFVSNGGYELTFILGLAALGIGMMGPGKLSLGKGKFCCTGKYGCTGGCCSTQEKSPEQKSS